MFNRKFIDKRFLGYPYASLLGALCCFLLALYSGFRVLQGMISDKIVIPGGISHDVALPTFHPDYLSFMDSPTDYYSYLFLWSLATLLYIGGGILCLVFIRNAGGLSLDTETRARRIVASMRQREDNVILNEFQKMIPTDCKTATLEVVTAPPDKRIKLYLSGQSGQPQLLGYHEELERPAENLFNLFRRHSLVVKKVVYHISADQDRRWKRFVDTVE